MQNDKLKFKFNKSLKFKFNKSIENQTVFLEILIKIPTAHRLIIKAVPP
jgi:hypothetical protein